MESRACSTNGTCRVAHKYKSTIKSNSAGRVRGKEDGIVIKIIG